MLLENCIEFSSISLGRGWTGVLHFLRENIKQLSIADRKDLEMDSLFVLG